MATHTRKKITDRLTCSSGTSEPDIDGVTTKLRGCFAVRSATYTRETLCTTKKGKRGGFRLCCNPESTTGAAAVSCVLAVTGYSPRKCSRRKGSGADTDVMSFTMQVREKEGAQRDVYRRTSSGKCGDCCMRQLQRVLQRDGAAWRAVGRCCCCCCCIDTKNHHGLVSIRYLLLSQHLCTHRVT